MRLAWTVANLSRGKRLPSLKSLLAPRTRGRVQSVREQKAQLSMLSTIYNIPLRSRSRRKATDRG